MLQSTFFILSRLPLSVSFDQDQRGIVLHIAAVGQQHGLEPFCQLLRGAGLGKQRLQRLRAERLQQSVGAQQDHVAPFERQRVLVLRIKADAVHSQIACQRPAAPDLPVVEQLADLAPFQPLL